MSREIISGTDLDPAYKARLKNVLFEPILLSPDDYTSGRTAPPTPLDPDMVYMKRNGWDYNTGGASGSPYDLRFRDYALTRAVAEIAHAKQLGCIPDSVVGLLQAEAVGQINNRADHNMAALERLVEALALRPPADDLMLDIVYRARAGMATLPEMVRLLKEYPEMISIETSNFRGGFLDPTKLQDAIRDAMEMPRYLRDNFNDAQITAGGIVTETRSQLVTGVTVRRYVLAEIESRDSHTQLIMKIPSLEAGARWNLGVTTYLRDFNHKDRTDAYRSNAVDISSEDLSKFEHLRPDDARRLIEWHGWLR